MLLDTGFFLFCSQICLILSDIFQKCLNISDKALSCYSSCYRWVCVCVCVCVACRNVKPGKWQVSNKYCTLNACMCFMCCTQTHTHTPFYIVGESWCQTHVCSLPTIGSCELHLDLGSVEKREVFSCLCLKGKKAEFPIEMRMLQSRLLQSNCYILFIIHLFLNYF